MNWWKCFVLTGVVLCSTLNRALAEPAPSIALEVFVRGIDHPTYLTNDGTQRLFIVEQPGRIRLMIDGKLQPKPYLDIDDHVQYGGECGLLSVAFHPDFAKNGYFYIN